MSSDDTLEVPSEVSDDGIKMESTDTGSVYAGWHGDILAVLREINDRQKELLATLQSVIEDDE